MATISSIYAQAYDLMMQNVKAAEVASEKLSVETTKSLES